MANTYFSERMQTLNKSSITTASPLYCVNRKTPRTWCFGEIQNSSSWIGICACFLLSLCRLILGIKTKSCIFTLHQLYCKSLIWMFHIEWEISRIFLEVYWLLFYCCDKARPRWFIAGRVYLGLMVPKSIIIMAGKMTAGSKHGVNATAESSHLEQKAESMLGTTNHTPNYNCFKQNHTS